MGSFDQDNDYIILERHEIPILVSRGVSKVRNDFRHKKLKLETNHVIFSLKPKENWWIKGKKKMDEER